MVNYNSVFWSGAIGMITGIAIAAGSAIYSAVIPSPHEEGKLKRVVEINNVLNSRVLHLPEGRYVEDLLIPSFRDEVVGGLGRAAAERDSLQGHHSGELIRENDRYVASMQKHNAILNYGGYGGAGLALLSFIPLRIGGVRKWRGLK